MDPSVALVKETNHINSVLNTTVSSFMTGSGTVNIGPLS